MNQLPVKIICAGCAGNNGHDRTLARYGRIVGPDVVPTDRTRALADRPGWGFTLGQGTRQHVEARIVRAANGTPYFVAKCRCGHPVNVRVDTIERRAANGERVIAV